jgi:hypothetical protein
MLSTRDGKLFAGDKEVIKGYESFSGWYWFATELVEDYEGHPLYFGYVQGFENEWGSFWMGELQPLIDEMKVWEIKPQDLPHAGRR